jgi:hypothetical protein
LRVLEILCFTDFLFHHIVLLDWTH